MLFQNTSNILSVADGRIVSTGVDNTRGEFVIIEHTVGNEHYRTYYFHLKENSRIFSVGDMVIQGSIIGVMGSTGYATGTHLHFSLLKYNSEKMEWEYQDPSIIIPDRNNNKFTTPSL